MFDDDYGAEAEAIEAERMDADLLQAEMERQGDVIAAARARGTCCHMGAAGWLPEPVYPEQEGLRPGQLRCTEGCGRVFENDEDWYQAMADAAG